MADHEDQDQVLLASLSERIPALYAENKFAEVERIFSSYIRDTQDRAQKISKYRAKAYNNRGHAK